MPQFLRESRSSSNVVKSDGQIISNSIFTDLNRNQIVNGAFIKLGHQKSSLQPLANELLPPLIPGQNQNLFGQSASNQYTRSVSRTTFSPVTLKKIVPETRKTVAPSTQTVTSTKRSENIVKLSNENTGKYDAKVYNTGSYNAKVYNTGFYTSDNRGKYHGE